MYTHNGNTAFHNQLNFNSKQLQIMKNAINKFLGVDILQEENLKLRSLLMDANKTINRVKQSVSILEDTDWNEVARDNFNYNDLAEAIDMYDLADNIETSDIAYNIDMTDLACHISTADVASELDMDEVIEGCGINIDTLAEQVAERIADREGMQHLVSEELDAQGVNSVTTDAVQSMIHAAIQQFADSLEVMVSAKLNYDK